MDDLTRLYEIRQCALAGDRIPDDTAKWIAGRIDAFLSGDPIRTPSRYQILKKRRDEHLRRAFAGLDEGLTEWRRCQLLSAGVRHFESRVWPRCRFDAKPPGRLTPIQVEFFYAMKTGLKLPATEQGLGAVVC